MQTLLGDAIEPRSDPGWVRTGIFNFVRTYHLSLVIGAGMLLFLSMYLWNSLPAPYNFTYQFKLATRDPSFVCKDGLYSFAATRNGACSGHGGIGRVYQK